MYKPESINYISLFLIELLMLNLCNLCKQKRNIGHKSIQIVFNAMNQNEKLLGKPKMDKCQ